MGGTRLQSKPHPCKRRASPCRPAIFTDFFLAGMVPAQPARTLGTAHDAGAFAVRYEVAAFVSRGARPWCNEPVESAQFMRLTQMPGRGFSSRGLLWPPVVVKAHALHNYSS